MELGQKSRASNETHLSANLAAHLVDRINVGVLTLGTDMTVLQWNRFLHAHTGIAATEVVGRNLFEQFPELDRDWIERKVRSVALLRAFAFSSWQQRPYVFRFQDHRTITRSVDPMRQDCTFIPLTENGAVTAVSIILIDATDTYESQGRLDTALAVLSEQNERDGLTGIYNRRKLDQVLLAEMKRVRRYGSELSLLMLDIDHFKAVNDRFGHLAGDEIIRHVAGTIVRTLRDTDLVARYGGEEFVALLPEVGSVGAAVAAERVRGAIADSAVDVGEHRLAVTVSVGVTSFRPEVADPKALIAEGDSALYRSKTNGRNRVTIFASADANRDQTR